MFDDAKLIKNLTRIRRLAPRERRLVDRTDPIGVLLISNDVPFRAVAGELLRRGGFTVTSDEQMTGVPRLAARAGAEVVVLDAEAAPVSVAAQAVAITKLCHPVGVVVLADNATTEVSGVRALPKWGAIDALYHAIDDARPHRGTAF